MNYDYYKLYLRNQHYGYEEAKYYKDFNKLLNDLGKYYHDFKGCLIIARDKINDCDVLVCSKEFNNDLTKSKKEKSNKKKNNIFTKVKKKHKKVKKKCKSIPKRLVRRRR